MGSKNLGVYGTMEDDDHGVLDNWGSKGVFHNGGQGLGSHCVVSCFTYQ